MEHNPSMDLTVPERILQPLLASANSSTLDEALEILLETSRTVHGRSDLASQNILPIILHLIKCLSNPLTHSLLFSSLKLLRNLCAGEILNQNLFITKNGVEVISLAFNSVGFNSNSDSGIVRIGLQLLGNVALGGEQHKTAVWGHFFPIGFMEIAKVGRLEICDTLCMVLYTCCSGNDERVGELCGLGGLKIVSEIIRTASTVGFEEDWLKWLLSRICFKESHFLPLFSKLSSAGLVDDISEFRGEDNFFAKEQAFLLSILVESLNQNLNEITVSNDFALCILGIVKRALGVVDLFARGKSSLPTGSPAIDVLGYSITILRDICAQGMGSSKSEDSTNFVDSLLSSGLLDLLLDMLCDLEPPEIIRKSISRGENQVASDSLNVCPYKGYRRDIVAVIGNCLYQRKHVQDEIRKKNGILLLMQQCVTEEENPFLREWGIWSVRNLLEGNEENQRQVTELEVQGSVDVPEIAGLGLRVEVDQKTRRAKLVNVS